MEPESGAAGDSGGASLQIADKTKLIINYIPQLANEEELHAIFSKVGIVESIRIMRDSRTGYSYGFGFVKYTTPDFALAAIKELNGMQFKYVLSRDNWQHVNRPILETKD